MRGGSVDPTLDMGTGATRSVDVDKIDPEGFLDPLVVLRFSEFMHHHRKLADGSTRDSDNWQKGMPRSRWIKSLWRHFLDLWLIHRNHPELATEKDLEVTLCALLFNVQGYLREVLLGRGCE